MEKEKLVRDKIPRIIRKSGSIPAVRIATQPEYWKKLKEKLVEETTEFLESENPQELVDILEVVFALAAVEKITRKKLGVMQKEKAKERGSFKKKILLADWAISKNFL